VAGTSREPERPAIRRGRRSRDGSLFWLLRQDNVCDTPQNLLVLLSSVGLVKAVTVTAGAVQACRSNALTIT